MVTERQIAAGTANLRPVQNLGPIAHRIYAQKGGQVKSQAKTDEAHWRSIKARIKKKGLSQEDQDWLLARLENREAIALDILLYTDEIVKDLHPMQRIALANTLLAACKFVHGEKIKTESVNVNVNTDINELERRMFGE